MDRERAAGRPSIDAVRRNVELLRRAAAAIGEDDLDAVVRLASDDFELHPAIAGAFVGATVYRGKDGGRRYLEDMKEVFTNFRFEPLSFSAWGDYLVCPSRVSGYGKASGASIDIEMTAIWRFTDGLIVWGATYFDRAEGLAAIGAREDELELIE
jgi:ketosteroid isomerase-like protein